MHRAFDVLLRIARPKRERFIERHVVRHIAIEGIVRARLIRQNVGNEIAAHQFRQDVGAIADEAYRDGLFVLERVVEKTEGVVERMRDLIAVTALEPFLDPRRIDIDAEKTSAVHRGGERLGATHSAHAAGHDEFAGKAAAEMFLGRGGERFESSLHDSLAADVDPRAGSHLPVHRQAKTFEAVELSGV